MKLFNVMVVYPLSERFWFRVLIYFEQFYSYGNCTANRFYMSGILVLNGLTKISDCIYFLVFTRPDLEYWGARGGQHLILAKPTLTKKRHLKFHHPLFKPFKKDFTTKYKFFLIFHEMGQCPKAGCILLYRLGASLKVNLTELSFCTTLLTFFLLCFSFLLSLGFILSVFKWVLIKFLIPKSQINFVFTCFNVLLCAFFFFALDIQLLHTTKGYGEKFLPIFTLKLDSHLPKKKCFICFN